MFLISMKNKYKKLNIKKENHNTRIQSQDQGRPSEAFQHGTEEGLTLRGFQFCVQAYHLPHTSPGTAKREQKYKKPLIFILEQNDYQFRQFSGETGDVGQGEQKERKDFHGRTQGWEVRGLTSGMELTSCTWPMSLQQD